MSEILTGMKGILFSAANEAQTTAISTDEILKPLINIKVLICAVVALIGAVVIVIEVMQFSSAYKQQDTSGCTTALKGIVGGVLMAGISTVLAFILS